jgi:hypothetical protein
VARENPAYHHHQPSHADLGSAATIGRGDHSNLMGGSLLLPEGDRVPPSAALASAIAAPFFLLLSTVGMSALEAGFEGVRLLVAAVAAFFLAVAAMMVSVTGRWLASLLKRAASPAPFPWLLSIIAFAGLLVGTYVFFAAAPGGPASADSWGELVAAVVGIWVGLTALTLLGERLMWGFVAVASVALVSASAAMTIL